MKSLQCLASYGDKIQYGEITLEVREYVPATRKIKLQQKINETSCISTYISVRNLNSLIRQGKYIIKK